MKTPQQIAAALTADFDAWKTRPGPDTLALIQDRIVLAINEDREQFAKLMREVNGR